MQALASSTTGSRVLWGPPSSPGPEASASRHPRLVSSPDPYPSAPLLLGAIERDVGAGEEALERSVGLIQDGPD